MEGKAIRADPSFVSIGEWSCKFCWAKGSFGVIGGWSCLECGIARATSSIFRAIVLILKHIAFVNVQIVPIYFLSSTSHFILCFIWDIDQFTHATNDKLWWLSLKNICFTIGNTKKCTKSRVKCPTLHSCGRTNKQTEWKNE